MKFIMEKNKDSSHRVTIKILNKIINNEIMTEFIKIRKKTNINGFRKGKIPIKIIKEKHGEKVYYDVFKKLMQKFFHDFIYKEKIKIIGHPKYYMNKNQNQKQEYFEYFVIYEKYPKFDIKQLKYLTAKEIIVNVTDKNITNIIEQNAYEQQNWETVNKPIKMYDRITVEYNIYDEKNQKIEKFNVKTIQFIVFKNTLFTQLNERVINHVVNDIIFFKVKFHQFHPEKELQNQAISFKIKIKKIEKLKEIDNQHTKEIKKFDASEYKIIKNNLNYEITKTIEEYLKNQILDNILKKNIIIIPKILLEEEVNKLYEKYKINYKENNHNILEKRYHYNLRKQAKKILCFKIIIEKIIVDNNLTSHKKNIKALIKKISLNKKKELELIDLYNKNHYFKDLIHNLDIETQAMYLLKKKVNIIQQEWNFDQFITFKWQTNQEVFL
ncbi:trigger factor [Buchnera aphidicola (Diuraphis noxia)]|uniref:Trigger factor n=1 Tax=Buchnera aphidicola subsp. Diuraphis noxia TaxID=118101 RepID=A0A1B2H901_BUCDN|nr:trigger factor [Buchnera aphidicola]ANZ22662.1 trigger factor [Buchnera aphidicola (Diuraphis noxia)]